jgi:REP element-mobilizing transposase RayT
MGRSRYKTYKDGHTYFITSSAIQWLPLFAMPALADIIINSLIHQHRNGHMIIHAWVLMETHMHLVATSPDMSAHMRNMKAYTAKCILDYLKEKGPDLFLKQMVFYKKRHKVDQDYQVWQEGIHPKQIIDESMLNIKINYVHYNPVKRGYVDKPEHWRYSSARDYAGTEGLVPIVRIV